MLMQRFSNFFGKQRTLCRLTVETAFLLGLLAFLLLIGAGGA